MSQIVEDTIVKQRQLIARVEKRHSEIDVVFELQRLLHAEAFSEDDHAFLDQAMRRVDIGNRLFSHYSHDWQKQPGDPIGDPWLGVLALLVFRRVCTQREAGASDASVLKALNFLQKCMDLTSSDDFAASSPLRQEINAFLDRPPAASEKDIFEPRSGRRAEATNPREVDLTVLFYEGPIARAYLETLRSMGLKPKRIINLIASTDIATKKPVGRWMPAAMRRPYAASIQQRKIHYWPQHIRRTRPELFSAISNWVAASLGFDQSTLEGALQMSPLTTYSDRVDELLVTGLNDPVLFEYLDAMPETAMLFTGGGIVPQSLLDIPSIRLLHVHPGFLPDIRGADCVLWSVLLTGAASASSFYLAPGIDTGDIVMAKWLPTPRFDADIGNYETKTLYRAVCSWYDPWLRACVLRETLNAHDRYFSMPSIEQNETSGTQFHFMHDKVREFALKSLFHR